MFGAILGDIIGSPYEFNNFYMNANEFPLFSINSTFTDDSVMTLAIADAIMNTHNPCDDDELSSNFVASMQKFGRAYPNAGYGSNFILWLISDNPKPYGSYGNGSAMRVSSVAWLFDDLTDTLRVARLSAAVSHNHPEGIKGAEATAAAIFLARKGADKDEIKSYISETFGYDFSQTCNEIRHSYRKVQSCMKTVPEAMTAFFETEDFEACIRTAVSLGGDCDTLAAIAGSIAEAYYGVPATLKTACIKFLPDDLKEILFKFLTIIS